MLGEDIIIMARNADSFEKFLMLERFSQALTIPRSTKDAIDNYVKHGLEPGSFVKAVLANDLKAAFGCADAVNTVCMRAIIMYVINSIPADCQGSPEKVEAWLGKFRCEP